MLAAARPSGEVDDPATWPKFRQLWPHLEVSRASESLEEPVRRLIIDRVRYVWQSGGYNDGRRLAEEYVDRWTEQLSALDDQASLRRQLLHLQFNLANILRDRADFAEARALDEQVLTVQRALLVDTHPHTLTTAGGLGASLRGFGLYDDALRLDEQTTAAWVENVGEDQQRTMMAMNNLASSLRLPGRVREARDPARPGLRQPQPAARAGQPGDAGPPAQPPVACARPWATPTRPSRLCARAATCTAPSTRTRSSSVRAVRAASTAW